MTVDLIIALILTMLPTASPVHDFHITIGRMSVENDQAVLQIRLYQDDLELGLQKHYADDSLRLQIDQKTDSLFQVYLNEKLVIKQGDELLTGVIATSGEDILYGYPVWWYSLTYSSSSVIETLDIDNRILMEMFEDQQNLIRITHYPSEKESLYYMVNGDSDITVKF